MFRNGQYVIPAKAGIQIPVWTLFRWQIMPSAKIYYDWYNLQLTIVDFRLPPQIANRKSKILILDTGYWILVENRASRIEHRETEEGFALQRFGRYHSVEPEEKKMFAFCHPFHGTGPVRFRSCSCNEGRFGSEGTYKKQTRGWFMA